MATEYPRGSLGHVLHHLQDWGVEESLIADMQRQFPAHYKLDKVIDGVLKRQDNHHDRILYGGHPFAEYRYFHGIEQPLFRWHVNVDEYYAHKAEKQEDGTFKPKFRLSLGGRYLPTLYFRAPQLTIELNRFINTQILGLGGMVDRSPGLDIYEVSGAAMDASERGIREEHRWRAIIFRKPQAAQALVDFINDNFRPTEWPHPSDLRTGSFFS